MFHMAIFGALGLVANGISIARVMRHDLSFAITRLTSEVGIYAKDGMEIMLKSKWLGRIPQIADRKELMQV